MITGRLDDIIAKERIGELMRFLQPLGKEEKKQIAAHLKELAKEYLEFRQTGTSWKQKASPAQSNMINIVAFVCLNRKDFQRFDRFSNILNNGLLDAVLLWYCPDWFSDFINDLTKQEWMPWTFLYRHAIDMEEKGYLKPSDELIARLIPQMIFHRNEKHRYEYAPENLLRRPVTLEKHFWLIFQYETSINTNDTFLQHEDAYKGEKLWTKSIQGLVASGRLDRFRLMNESIVACHRNFSKALSAWFVELFESFDPTPTELLLLQNEIINNLNSQHSRVVNGALNALKKIVDENGFNVRGFLDHAPILLSSETKSVVSSALMIFEKLMRSNPDLEKEICVMACQAFIHQDEPIQTRACKLFLKRKNIEGILPELKPELAKYTDSMLMSSRKLLSDLIDESLPVIIDDKTLEHSIQSEWKPLNVPATVDELIFLSSQAFDNNDPMHIDLLPAALINMQEQLQGSMLHKFEAAFQRAYKLLMGDWRSGTGFLDHLLATFFVETMWLLMDRFPAEAASLKEVDQFFRRKDNEGRSAWAGYQSRIPELYTWSVQSRDNTYIIHKTLLYFAYEKIKNGQQQPLLSTPTHECGFVDPIVLIDRLAQYQRDNVFPNDYDFQIAISRIAPFHHDEARALVKTSLNGEASRLMEFLLDVNASPTAPFTTPSLWFMAAATKNPSKTYLELNGLFYSTLPRTIFTGDVSWKSFVEHYKITQYNFQKKQNEQVPAERAVLRLILPPVPKIWQEPKTERNIFKRFVKMLVSPAQPKREHSYLLYEFLSLRAKWLSAEDSDIQRFLFLFPSNPNPLIALITARTLENSTLSSEIEKRLLTRTCEVLVKMKFHWSEITHVFLASAMLVSDKTVRSFAAELWIQAVLSGSVDNENIGRIIGIHFAGEYAPMKRFTDLISANLLKISSSHNLALEKILTNVIAGLKPEPPVGTKRLLELYSEVLQMNGSVVVSTEQVNRNLNTWGANAGFKKVLSSIPVKA